ncbi:MAG TPA: sensor histidine kinase [Blastococcus sp.]|nr:sensor histidine kinase [Blastococcus sp.]
MRPWVPRPIDLAVAAVLCAATEVELWLVAPAGLPLGAVAASFAVGTLAFAWHRVAPLPALSLGMTGLAVVPGALGVDPALALGWFVTAMAFMASAGFHARRPVVALAVAFALLCASIVLLKGLVVADVLFAWLLAGGAWLGGRAVAGRTLRAELSEQRAAAAEQQAQWRAATAVAEERLRIAREMHDVVSHDISVMTLHVSGVRRLLRPDQHEERAALETAERTGRESLAEMHRMLGVLRGPGLDDDRAAPGLGRLAELLDPARAAGLQVGLTVGGDVRPLPPGVELAAYRIVQEAVTNVLKHAAAHRIDCTVDYGAAAVELRITDDGAGATGPAPGGHGLVGMAERAAVHGGWVDAGPNPGGGWSVRAVLALGETRVETPPGAREGR